MRTKASILIVDDVSENLKLLSELLINNNYYVRPATNGKLALAAAEAIPPDLILLDISMPVMDGFETCKRLKNLEKTKDIPVIFLTAKAENSDLIKGFELGAVDYITKPFYSKEVLVRIETHLDLKFSKELILKQNYEQRELLHILSHDLLNSIGLVKSFLDLKDIENVFTDYDKVMLRGVNNAIEIIDLVRQLRSIEEGKANIKLELYNLKSLLFESFSIIEKKIQDKKIDFKINVSEDIFVNVERISFVNSVLNNLFTNAIKFSFPNSKIIITAQIVNNHVELSIKDFGMGMSEELQNNIFKINKVTTRAGTNGEQGTGFGMPLVKKFIDIYGAKISILSNEIDLNNEKVEHGTEIKLLLKSKV